MRSNRQKSAATVGGHPDEIEAQFYDALRSGDLARLMACWADEDEIVCVHPGGPRLVGAAQIRAGFETIFARGAPQVRIEDLHRVETLSSCVHNLVEKVMLETPGGPREAFVVTTNVYHKTAQGWRMVAHHTTPGALGEAAPTLDAPSQSQTLH